MPWIWLSSSCCVRASWASRCNRQTAIDNCKQRWHETSSVIDKVTFIPVKYQMPPPDQSALQVWNIRCHLLISRPCRYEISDATSWSVGLANSLAQICNFTSCIDYMRPFYRSLTNFFITMFNLSSTVMGKVTRRSTFGGFYPPVAKLEMTKKGFRYRGVKVWEKVPNELKTAKSWNVFKKYICQI